MGDLEIGLLDLASLDEIKRFAKEFTETHRRLDILVNNAGGDDPSAVNNTRGL